MNAHDSGYHREPARSLTEGTLALLRQAIEQRWGDPSAAERPLRDALAVVAAEARARTLRPEELIVAVKGVLAELATIHPGLTSADELRLRERVVTWCIEAYYSQP